MAPTRRTARFLPVLAVAMTAGLFPPDSVQAMGGPEILSETVISGYRLGSGRQLVAAPAGHVFLCADYQGDKNDILVARVETDGSVAWTRSLRGNAIDISTDVALDANGDLLIAGWTDSTDFETTPDALYPDRNAHREGFLMRLSAADGSTLYSTLLGGNHSEQIEAIAVDADGSILMAGRTDSPDFPIVNALQPEMGNAAYAFDDGFVARLDPTGQTLVFSTYFGASRDDTIEGIAIQPDGRIVVAGTTDSGDLPLEGGLGLPFQGGYRDVFAAVLSADGQELVASTYLGGYEWEHVYGLAVGPGGSAYIAGWTQSANFPTTPTSLQPNWGGGICLSGYFTGENCPDGFVTRLTPLLDEMIYSTYFGGYGTEEIRDLAVDVNGRASVGGYSFASDFPATAGPGNGIFAARLSPSGATLDFAFTIDSEGSGNQGHAIAISSDAGSTWVAAAKNVPADVFVAQIGRHSEIFAEGFESGTTASWTSVEDE